MVETFNGELLNHYSLFRSYFLLSFQSFLIKLASRFIKKGFSLPSGLGHLCKKTAFTVFRKNTEAKGVSFGWRFKIEMFLSVFSEESYIFEINKRNKLSLLCPYLIVFTKVCLADTKVKCNRTKNIPEKI